MSESMVVQLLLWLVPLLLLAGLSLAAGEENLGRGLVALPTEQGVYLGWRLLAEDPNGVAFDVYRRQADEATFQRIMIMIIEMPSALEEVISFTPFRPVNSLSIFRVTASSMSSGETPS